MSKVNETEETVVENVEGEVVETENFSEKTKAGLKKYGKKLVVAASLVGVALIGYAIGARKSENSDDTTYEIEDSSSSDES